MVVSQEKFVLGLDLDGCVADFVGRMREIYSEWSGIPIDELDANPTYEMPEWKLAKGEYPKLHRFAVNQRDLFSTMKPIAGAAQALRRLSAEGIWIRVATHRLFIDNFHAQAAEQTIRWLEQHDIRYWDLCLIKDKSAIFADLFIEDNPSNIRALLAKGTDTICITNSINRDDVDIKQRAANWDDAESMIRAKYYAWLKKKNLTLPPGPGLEPTGT